jgi:hypothetical protein
LKLSAVAEHPDLVNKILDSTQMRTGVRRGKKKRWGLLVFCVDGPLLFQATGQKKPHSQEGEGSRAKFSVPYKEGKARAAELFN